jgi:transposase
MMAAQLSARQQEVKELLDQGMQPKQIGDHLGISRNAVYQTISRLKKYGVIEEAWTPSGAPPRSPSAAQALADITGTPGASEETHARPPGRAPLSAALLQELAQTQQELARIANRLAKYLE